MKRWFFNFMGVFVITFMVAFIVFVLLGALGCAANPKRRMPTPEGASSDRGFALVDAGTGEIGENVTALTSMPLPPPARARVEGVDHGLRMIVQGRNEAKKACDEAIKASSDAARDDATVYRRWMIVGAFAAAGGVVAMLALASVTGIPVWVKRIGHAVFGGAIVLIIIMMSMQQAQRFLYIAIPGAAVIFLVALAVVAVTLVKQWKNARKEQQINREMVASTTVALAHLPEEVKPAVYESIKQIQSPATETMVREVKATTVNVPAVSPEATVTGT